MSDPQNIWCQPGDQQRRQFVVLFDDPDKAMAVFDNEADARDFWEKASIDWNCHLLGALPRDPDANPAADILDRLKRIAEKQREFFEHRQREFPCIEDFLEEDGVLKLPHEIDPLMSGSHYNGRFSEADWWLSTIRQIAKDYPEPRRSDLPVAYACEADIEMLQDKPDGCDISLSPHPMPQYGMNMALYADADGSRAVIQEELRSVRAVLRPFSEAFDAYGDNPLLADSISLPWALQTSKLVVTGLSIGDLRRAKEAMVERKSEAEEILPRPSGSLGEMLQAITDELVDASRKDAVRHRDTAGRILGRLLVLREGSKR